MLASRAETRSFTATSIGVLRLLIRLGTVTQCYTYSPGHVPNNVPSVWCILHIVQKEVHSMKCNGRALVRPDYLVGIAVRCRLPKEI